MFCFFLYEGKSWSLCLSRLHEMCGAAAVCERRELSLSFPVCKFKPNRRVSREGDFICIAISTCCFSASLLFLSPHRPTPPLPCPAALPLSAHVLPRKRPVASIQIQAAFLSLPLHRAARRRPSLFHLINYLTLIWVMSLLCVMGETSCISSLSRDYIMQHMK